MAHHREVASRLPQRLDPFDCNPQVLVKFEVFHENPLGLVAIFDLNQGQYLVHIVTLFHEFGLVPL